MADDDAVTEDDPAPAQPPAEGGTGTAVVDDGSQFGEERENHAEGGAGQHGRGRFE